jgi:hypothetical protein
LVETLTRRARFARGREFISGWNEKVGQRREELTLVLT